MLQGSKALRTLIEKQGSAIAKEVVARHYEQRPRLATRYGVEGQAKCRQDFLYHLDYLCEALAAENPGLFEDYVGWAKVMLEERGISADDLAVNLKCIAEVLAKHLPDDIATMVERYISQGLQILRQVDADSVSSFLAPEVPQSELARQYLDLLLEGDRRKAGRLILETLEGGTPLRDIYLNVFQRSQREIGRRWQLNRLTVAQEHFCTAATQQIMAQLYPYIFNSTRRGTTFVMACVSDELHEIGARMVSDFMEMDGWDTYFLGANMPTRDVVQTVVERQTDLLGISATLTPHISAVEQLIQAVRAHEACREVKIIVGGYPFIVAPNLWKDIDADACAGSADEAVHLAAALVSSTVER